MKRTSAFVMVVMLCCSTLSTVDAQTGWLPRSVDLGPNITGANRAAVLARLDAIERLVKQVPELAHPDGFEIRPFVEGSGRRTGPGKSEHAEYAIQYTYRLTFFYPSFAANKYAIGDVVFVVNADENVRAWVDAQGRDVYVEGLRWRPPVPSSVATFVATPSGTTVQKGDDFTLDAWFTAGGESPWRSVSREEFYNAVLVTAEGNNGEKRAEVKKATEKTGYERWLEEAPQRKKEREEALKAVAQFQPAAEVQKLRKTMEDAEREAGEQLKKNESADRESAKSALKPTDDVRAELNRMTPAQRKLPAIVDAGPNKSEFSATGVNIRDPRDTLTANLSRVLMPNYDFWRARKSPVEPRTMLVHLEATSTPPISNAVYQMYKKFDWRALAALMDQPGKP